MLQFCRFLEYNFIILKYACVTDLSCNSHTSPAKIEQWRFSSNFKFQRGFLHVSSHTVFKMDYLHNLDQMNAFTKFLCCTLLKVLFHARGYFQLIAPGLFAFHFCSFSISHFLSWVISCFLKKLR